MCFRTVLSSRCLLLCALSLFTCLITTPAYCQNTVTGAFEGVVSNSQTRSPISGASVQFVNQLSEIPLTRRTDAQGHFYQGLLAPGNYKIRISAPGFKTKEMEQRLLATRPNEVVPVPVTLDPETPGVTAPVPTPTGAPQPATGQPAQSQTAAQTTDEDRGILAEINATDARRSMAFTEEEVPTLPLGATTLTRTFDDLALLAPGVALPPQTQGSVAGPGVGAGVGSAGQFAVNGLRSRANNFTVDGSDNNDEDIGVRRQGFLALVPQPVESIQEYQVITLLAPAQFGRNIGAQVNAISKSGGNDTHGTIYGFVNTSQLNARDFFDTTYGNATSALRAGNDQPVLLDNRPLTVQNQSGDRDSFTLGQAGFVLGGPLMPDQMFYFISAEGYLLNATKEESFAVPTVEQRGAFGSGATGIFANPFSGSPASAFPTTLSADAVFSLFPFPNNPRGIYGANTFTQALPASGQGKVMSGKIDGRFKVRERQQSFTARYNFTDDWRNIPATGGAIFSTLRPRVRTQNLSAFLNSEVTGPNSNKAVFNQVRLSYGRTRLNFEEGRDKTFLRSSGFADPHFGEFGLLNAPLTLNLTEPSSPGVRNTGPVRYSTFSDFSTEDLLGPVGQIVIAGFSPIGVDVFNFPQRRVNNTYQVADTLTWRLGGHSFAFGTDLRRTELHSELPRNFRPLITFNGAPQLTYDPLNKVFARTNRFIRPEDLAASSAASGFSQTLVPPEADSHINLRYYQLNFFGQDEWRVRPNLSLSYGLRYEYNTPPRESRQRIESTFNSPDLGLVPDLRKFLEGRTRIFEPDRNNLEPRFGIAYSPNLFGRERVTVIRAGYGLFYDQILGAVVSQSRNVFPNFLTVSLPGGISNVAPNFPFGLFELYNPRTPLAFEPGGEAHTHVQEGTLNTLNPMFSLADHIFVANLIATGGGILPAVSGIGATLPARRLNTPLAHQYSLTVDQQLGPNVVISAAYVGTQGHNLLRFTTPNLGPNAFLVPLAFSADAITIGSNTFSSVPSFFGLALPPGTLVPDGQFSGFTGGRPFGTVGTINRFEATARSRYDALQLQARGRFHKSLQYQMAYTFSKATDDVSDVFDLAGAPSLPQNSLTFAGERGPANFDVRHRFAYNFIYGLPEFRDRSYAFRLLLEGLQIAGTGQFQSGQPFTVNSIFDANLDGNLTDRLNTTSGIVVTRDRRQPLRLTTNDPTTLLAPIGQDGAVGRNTFRAGSILELDMAVIKNFAITEQQKLTFRMDLFNFINRANFGIPVRFLEAPGFGLATSTVTPRRRIQFALKYSF